MTQGEPTQGTSPEGSNVKPPGCESFFSKYKCWIIGGVVIAVIAGGIVFCMCMPAATASAAAIPEVALIWPNPIFRLAFTLL